MPSPAGSTPEYGNALSGVVDISTRTGPRQVRRRGAYLTDDFGRQDRTYTNFDQFEFGFGGPSPLKKLTYFVTGHLRFSDGENFDRAYRPEHSVELFGVELFKYRQRQFNDSSLGGKIAYYFYEAHKLTAEYTLNYARRNQFRPNWDVRGGAGKWSYCRSGAPGSNAYSVHRALPARGLRPVGR